MSAPQGSPEWFAARLGKLTASRLADVLATTKSGPSASRKNYAAQLVCERLTGVVADTFTNDAIRWGQEQEPFARAAYEMRTNAMVEEAEFVDHPSIPMSGASPDGIVGEGLVEIKCPNTATHIEYLVGKKPPTKYVAQMTWQIACTGAKWCDFVSFDPRLPETLRLFVVRFTPAPEQVTEAEAAVREFLAEVDATVEQLQKMAA